MGSTCIVLKANLQGPASLAKQHGYLVMEVAKQRLRFFLKKKSSWIQLLMIIFSFKLCLYVGMCSACEKQRHKIPWNCSHPIWNPTWVFWKSSKYTTLNYWVTSPGPLSSNFYLQPPSSHFIYEAASLQGTEDSCLIYGPFGFLRCNHVR